MTTNDDEDPTVPSGNFEEDATVPSMGSSDSAGKEEKSEEPSSKQGEDERTPSEDDTVAAVSLPANGQGSGELIGKTLGGCRIDKLLGRGAMGAVYKARQLKLDRDVAVKVIRPEMMVDARMLKRFEIEARTVGKFNSPHVVMVHDVGFEHGVHYLVMEFVEGRNLRELVKLEAGGRLTAGKALPLIEQACKGLSEARRLQVVHRDIKPDNLMLTDQGVLKIADFGIAKPEEDFSMTLTSELIGTPLYMSPEQCHGGAAVDFRSDMYSLGATFFYLLTGEPPIRASSVYELIQTKTKLENLCLWKALPELDENNPLSRVIERMTANDCDDRYASYEALLNDLLLVKEGREPTRSEEKQEHGGSQAEKKGRGGALAFLLVLLVACAVGGYWWVEQGKSVSSEDLVAADALLEGFRDKLRADGPSEGLKRRIEDLAVPAARADTKTLLIVSVTRGLELQSRLGPLEAERPEKPVLPFDDLESYWQDVARAAAVEPRVDPALRDWLVGRLTQALEINRLGELAAGVLIASWGKWLANFEQLGSGQGSRDELRDRLNLIEGGRRRLLARSDLPRAVLLQIEEQLTQDALDKARANLLVLGKSGPSPQEISIRLDEIRARFLAEGPSKAIESDLEKMPTSVGDKQKLDDLKNEVKTANGVQERVEKLGTEYPKMPRAPFKDVQGFFNDISEQLQKVALSNGDIPAWARSWGDEARHKVKVQDLVIEECESLRDDLKASADSGGKESVLQAQAEKLRQAVARANELFPAAASLLAQRVPLDEVTKMMEQVRYNERKAKWLSRFEEVKDRLQRVSSIADWAMNEEQLSARAKQLSDDLAGFDQSPEMTDRLNRLMSDFEKWRKDSDRFDLAATALAEGRCKDCLDQLDAYSPQSITRRSFDDLGSLARQYKAVQETLADSLDLAAALTRVEEVRQSADRLDLQRVVRAMAGEQGRLEKLKVRTSGMVPIAKGSTRNPRANVGAFFIAATECSNADFQSFIDKVRAAAVGGTSAERFQSVEDRFSGCGLDEAKFEAMLDKKLRGEAIDPANVSWHHAAAFCSWGGYELPTRAEWALAAFGDNNAKRYPWGDDPEPSRAKKWQFNISDRVAAVDDGGLSWRSADGFKLHHLAGNMAEWLAADAVGRMAQCVGGGYTKDAYGGSAKGLAEGRDVATESRNHPSKDVGFRYVLRVSF